jgi:DNA-nicking Smr family endonuclease
MSISDWIKKLMSRPRREPDPIDEDSDMGIEDPFPEPVDIEITDVFDLHTIPPRDVKRIVEEYLFQAREKGFRSVRIIHGKGIGVQRTMVRSILARTPSVTGWTDAPPEAGGQGATIVRLTLEV